MAELSLSQISDKLNQEFNSEERKLIFWYDENGEFKDDVDNLPLTKAKVWHLQPDNQFETKYHLECVDTTSSYLVYAPFAKPDLIHNHLADTLRYSSEFFAERISLIMADLCMSERLRPVLQHYKRFFDSKDRVNRFCSLEIESWDQPTIEQAILCVLCKCKVPTYEEILRTVLMDGGLDDNQFLVEFDKYGVLDAFWQLADKTFGFLEAKPTLEKLMMTLLATYCSKTFHGDVPTSWQGFVTSKSGSCMAFIDNLMNNQLYSEWYDVAADRVFIALDGAKQLTKLGVEVTADCAVFEQAEPALVKYLVERLEAEDTGAQLNGQTIFALCQDHKKTHFGQRYAMAFDAIVHAWYLISHSHYTPSLSCDELSKAYIASLFEMDRHYRLFWYAVDSMPDTIDMERLSDLVEAIYTNDYLSQISTNWNDVYSPAQDSRKQVNFFDRVGQAKDQVVVIISDAMRYEVGVSLFERLQQDEKCTVKMDSMRSTLPSITKIGMAALLPHHSLSMTEDGHVLVDGLHADSCEQREFVLRRRKANSRCVQYDTIAHMSVAELREIFTRQDVVYVYHNQIDARGDKASTENEVFKACEEAVVEIAALIRRLTTAANRSHFFVTSDHGFMYKRKALAESDKIATGTSYVELSRRYCISDEPVTTEGVGNRTLGSGIENEDGRYVSFPMGADVFKAHGGANYAHGGSSPQEMIVPVLEVRTEKAHKEVANARIALVSHLNKITRLILPLDFVQSEPVSDTVKETSYHLYFIDEDGNKISSEQKIAADSKEKDTAKRIFKVRFNFKNKAYTNAKRYYLIAVDEQTGLELLRHEVFMDVAFGGNFGF